MRKYFFAFFFITIAALTSCRPSYESFDGYAQGGTYRIKYSTAGVRASKSDIRHTVDSLLTVIDTTLSGYNASSQLSRFNAGESVDTSGMFDRVYKAAKAYYELTEGALDCGSGPLFDVWGFGFTRDSLPSPELLAAALEECKSWKKLNFNAIAQGFSCDVVAEYLREIGVRNMLVDIGEIYCCGVNPSGQGWSVGVDNPVDGNQSPGADLRGIWESDGGSYGIVTSGNYRKFYIKDGRKYSHTIDPRTGYPVDHGLLSATIVAPTAELADAVATYCMVIGPEASREFILGREDFEGYLITSDGVWTSPGFTLR